MAKFWERHIMRPERSIRITSDPDATSNHSSEGYSFRKYSAKLMQDTESDGSPTI